MNEKTCHEELTPTPENYSKQSELQKQARFIDKAKRIKQNLLLIENLLIIVEPDSPPIELLYEPPEWSVPPDTKFYFDVRKGESLLTRVDISESGHYLLGRLPICDIVMNDETCSRQHAVIQFRPSDVDEEGDECPTDEIYIYDLGSTSGTYVNGMPLQERAYYPLYPGDILQFGQFPNAFILQEGEMETPTTTKETDIDIKKESIDIPTHKLEDSNGTSKDEDVRRANATTPRRVNTDSDSNPDDVITQDSEVSKKKIE